MGPAGRIGCQETERVGVRGSDGGGGLHAVLAIGPGVERSTGRAAPAAGQVLGPDGAWGAVRRSVGAGAPRAAGQAGVRPLMRAAGSGPRATEG